MKKSIGIIVISIIVISVSFSLTNPMYYNFGWGIFVGGVLSLVFNIMDAPDESKKPNKKS